MKFSTTTQALLALAALAPSLWPFALLAQVCLGCERQDPPSTAPTEAATVKLTVSRVIVPKYDLQTKVGMLGLPLVLLPTHDGNLIAAGNGTVNDTASAYAAKIAPDGGISWSYWVKPHEILDRDWQPQYAGGVVMDDGSVFLAGVHPENLRRVDAIWRGILTHLDANGTAVADELVLPKSKNIKRGRFFSIDGVRMGNTAIFLSSVHKVTLIDQGKSPPIIEYFFWLIAKSQDGTTAWEKIVPLPDGYAIEESNCHLLALKDEGMVIISERSGAYPDATLMIKLNAKGEEVKRKTLNDRTMFVRSMGQDAIFQKLNITRGGQPMLTTYDKDLNAVKEEVFQKWPVEGKFRPSAVYRTPEGYFFTASDEQGRPHVVYAKDAASPMLSAYVGDPDTKDSPHILAATPTGKPGEFAVAPDVQSRHIVILQAPVTPPATKP